MPSKFYLFALALASGAFFLTGNSSGAGAVQDLDRTGSPLAVGNCSSCHNGGNYGVQVNLSLLEEGGEAVQTYVPGESYTLRLAIEASNSPVGYGFQTVPLYGEDNAMAGAWGDAPDGLQVTALGNGRDYFEHSERRPENVFDLPWTAPAEDVGPIRFYAAGNAVNGNGASGGDRAEVLEEPLTIQPRSTALRAARRLPVQLRAWPNPVRETVQLSVAGAEPGAYQLWLTNAAGQRLLGRALELSAVEQIEAVDLSDLPAGYYQLTLTDGRRVAGLPLLKK